MGFARSVGSLTAAFLLAGVVACSGSVPKKGGAVGGTGPGSASGPTPTLKATIAPTDDDPGGTAQEVFERGKLLLTAGKPKEARLLFDRVVAAEQAEGNATTPLGRAAAYNAALATEALDVRDARDRYRKLALAAPETTDAVDANLRRARLDVEIEDYDDLGKAAAALLARSDLGDHDRAETFAYQGLAAIRAGDLPTATKVVAQATKILDRKGPNGEELFVPPHNAAAVHFARGELIRAESLAIVFVPKDGTPVSSAEFPAKMEARCQKILDAQDAYIDAINTKEVHWAVRGGLRVASMYIALHDDVLAIPPPKSADSDKKKALFRGAMRLRYRILLEKGLSTLEHTLNLEKAVGAKGAWLEQARKSKATLDQQLAEEKAEIAKLPYTEAELQKAFDDLAGKSPKT